MTTFKERIDTYDAMISDEEEQEEKSVVAEYRAEDKSISSILGSFAQLWNCSTDSRPIISNMEKQVKDYEDKFIPKKP